MFLIADSKVCIVVISQWLQTFHNSFNSFSFSSRQHFRNQWPHGPGKKLPNYVLAQDVLGSSFNLQHKKERKRSNEKEKQRDGLLMSVYQKSLSSLQGFQSSQCFCIFYSLLPAHLSFSCPIIILQIITFYLKQVRFGHDFYLLFVFLYAYHFIKQTYFTFKNYESMPCLVGMRKYSKLCIHKNF